MFFYIHSFCIYRPLETRGRAGGLRGCSPLLPPLPQIFAKVDLLPIDNDSKKKKVTKNINHLKFHYHL